MTTYEGIKRAGPPQAMQKLREDLYLVQVHAHGDAHPPTGSACFTKRSSRRRRNFRLARWTSAGLCCVSVPTAPAWKRRRPGSTAGSSAPIRKRPRWAGDWTKSAGGGAKNISASSKELAASGTVALGRNCRSQIRERPLTSTSAAFARFAELRAAVTDSWQRQPNRITTNCWASPAKRRRRRSARPTGSLPASIIRT